MVEEPTSKLTVPLPPVVTVAMNVMAVPTFWGERSNDATVTEDAIAPGDVRSELVPAGPGPPELSATTLKVAAVFGGNEGIVHDVEVDATVHD